ncbi:MAG: hypothetical protein EB119_10845, partial [Synechococcaceae bacterium WBB_34_004]|nr:hypothetical protein [Synechococcaceae bacterium WBB_34_004]
MAAGATKREAYLASHEPDKASSKTITMMASRAAASPNVQAALSQQQAVERLRYSQNPLEIRNFVVDSLQHLARTAQKDSDRLAALKMLGQLADVQAFETKSIIEHRSASDTKVRLAEKLRRLTIDVEATPLHPTPGGEGQTGRVSGGPSRPNNPHQHSEENGPHEDEILDGEENAPQEHPPIDLEVGSHTEVGVKKKKKEKPIWQDPK